MKNKIILSILLAISLNAGVIDSTKEVVNKAMFWKGKHLSDVNFSNMYPKKFYNKSYFGVAITGAAVAGGIAFSYLTAGAGAPAATTGVGAVATWVGGGGAGSYMAGLSTIGSVVGGNAMTGAAILNGISYGIIGGAASKIGIAAAVTASSLDGIFYFKNKETNELEYKIKLDIPKNLGSSKTRKLVDKIYEADEEINDAIEDNDITKQKKYTQMKIDYLQEAIKELKKQLTLNDNQEDLLVLGIIAYNQNEDKLFEKTISKIDTISSFDDMGFLYYLYSLKFLVEGDTNKATSYLKDSIDENSYAMEPYILLINIYGNEGFSKNENKIINLYKEAIDKFDDDKYATKLSKATINYRIATFYYNSNRFIKAKEYYENAYDELGFLQKHWGTQQLSHIINLGVVNSLFKAGKLKKATEKFTTMYNDIDDKKEKTNIKSQYIGFDYYLKNKTK